MGIRLENVSYQDKIKNISYEFEDGKITTVIGSSSSGKTLLSYLLSGIIDDYTGNISKNPVDAASVKSNLTYRYK